MGYVRGYKKKVDGKTVHVHAHNRKDTKRHKGAKTQPARNPKLSPREEVIKASHRGWWARLTERVAEKLYERDGGKILKADSRDNNRLDYRDCYDSVEWKMNGKTHREGGKPAIVHYFPGGKYVMYEACVENGQYHNVDGPATRQYKASEGTVRESYYVRGVKLDKPTFDKFQELRNADGSGKRTDKELVLAAYYHLHGGYFGANCPDEAVEQFVDSHAVTNLGTIVRTREEYQNPMRGGQTEHFVYNPEWRERGF